MTIGEDERVSLQAVAEMHNITVDPFKFSMSKFLFFIFWLQIVSRIEYFIQLQNS